MMQIDPSGAVPIWRQIEDGVCHLVASGALQPEDPVASVRELARELRVNPLTVSKAYRRLVDRGVLKTQRGEGTFVASDPPRLAAGELDRRLREGARRYAVLARTLGVSDDDGVAVLRRELAGLDAGVEDSREEA